MSDKIDLATAEVRKSLGIHQVTDHNRTWVNSMREIARQICAKNGSVTTDDLRVYADNHDFHPRHPNAWGAIFHGNSWKCVGTTNSKYVTNHSRTIRVWVSKREPIAKDIVVSRNEVLLGTILNCPKCGTQSSLYHRELATIRCKVRVLTNGPHGGRWVFEEVSEHLPLIDYQTTEACSPEWYCMFCDHQFDAPNVTQVNDGDAG